MKNIHFFTKTLVLINFLDGGRGENINWSCSCAPLKQEVCEWVVPVYLKCLLMFFPNSLQQKHSLKKYFETFFKTKSKGREKRTSLSLVKDCQSFAIGARAFGIWGSRTDMQLAAPHELDYHLNMPMSAKPSSCSIPHLQKKQWLGNVQFLSVFLS